MTAQIEAVDLCAFDNSYARLPDRFSERLPPTPVVAPRLVRLNETLALHLKLDPRKLATPDGAEILAGNRVPKKGEPLAMAYAGHQFGTFVPQLGDGRAILLGEVIDRDGVRRDIQLKGFGPTPFSRRGDGRAARGLCCANTSSARGWQRSGFRRPDARRSVATASDRVVGIPSAAIPSLTMYSRSTGPAPRVRRPAGKTALGQTL